MEFKDLSVELESERFENHLGFEKNKRIIFSGIFGIGKTYFLDKFFISKSDKFISIKINPVNYTVSPNQDIFELIKFDIGFQLFSKNPNFDKIDFDTSVSAEYYLINNYKNVIKSLTESLSKLDYRLDRIIKPVLELDDKINEFKKDNETDDKGELQEFLNVFSKKIGTTREENTITDLLNKLIDSLRGNNPDKEVVLVIDDLDRIDPEHIFRIMNVFSAHLDYYDRIDENKFGFDKIILVCDIDNIRGIYHAKYGTDIDFSGYIDKFYSLEVFKYDHSKVISNSLNKFLRSIRFASNSVNFDINGDIGFELKFLLSEFISAGALSMRGLINFLKNELIIPEYSIKTGIPGGMNVYSQNTPILIIFHVLEKILGGKKELIKALEKVIIYKPSVEFTSFMNYWNRKLGNIIILVDYENSQFKISQNRYYYKNERLDISISYKIINSLGYYGVIGEASRILFFNDNIEETSYEMNESIKKNSVPYFQLFKEAYLNLNLLNREI